MKINTVAVIVRDPNNQWEGLRSSLGLGLEVVGPHMFVVGEVKIAPERAEGYKASLEYLKEELEGRHFTDHAGNVAKWGFFEFMSQAEMARKLLEYDLVIPF